MRRPLRDAAGAEMERAHLETDPRNSATLSREPAENPVCRGFNFIRLKIINRTNCPGEDARTMEEICGNGDSGERGLKRREISIFDSSEQ
jgi:hypothetical protein